MAASAHVRDGTLEIGPAKPLFEITYRGPGVLYDVSPDGRRFLVNTSSQAVDLPPLTLRLNWTATGRDLR
ncbi:MAG: hypothetical protein ACREAA_12860 [Candidatus Polarisedimenticolia bacterium]